MAVTNRFVFIPHLETPDTDYPVFPALHRAMVVRETPNGDIWLIRAEASDIAALVTAGGWTDLGSADTTEIVRLVKRWRELVALADTPEKRERLRTSSERSEFLLRLRRLLRNEVRPWVKNG